ncbi:MAG: hypothetical protein Fur0024_0790 [Patescibacteria group bacterium]
MKKFFSIIFFIFFLNSCSSNKNENFVKVETENGEKIFEVEIADSDTERRKGLMYRKSLKDNEGMLFVFDSDKNFGAFWMKNTEIPLDIIFIEEVEVKILNEKSQKQLKVLNIEEAVPCKQEDPTQKFCRNYYPDGEYKYVLEVVGGVSRKLKIEKGAKVEWVKEKAL